MRLIIAGGRDYRLSAADFARLDTILGVTEVVSGACRGVDQDGEAWAAGWGLPVKRFPADWKTHGKAAGPLRNRQMAQYADAVALFPGGIGTASMHAEALAVGLTIYDWRGS